MNIEREIEEILKPTDEVLRNVPNEYDWQVKELLNLIEKQREEGVRGFGRWFDGGSGQFDSKINEYLQSLDKGDTDE